MKKWEKNGNYLQLPQVRIAWWTEMSVSLASTPDQQSRKGNYRYKRSQGWIDHMIFSNWKITLSTKERMSILMESKGILQWFGQWQGESVTGQPIVQYSGTEAQTAWYGRSAVNKAVVS